LSVTVTSYLLALAVCAGVGYMADRFGARRVFSAAIGVFAMGSLGSALTQGLETMAAARFLQGIGGAMMLPVGRLVMLRTVPPKDLVNATSWMLMPGLMGTIWGRRWVDLSSPICIGGRFSGSIFPSRRWRSFWCGATFPMCDPKCRRCLMAWVLSCRRWLWPR
jgi:MFS family permease